MTNKIMTFPAGNFKRIAPDGALGRISWTGRDRTRGVPAQHAGSSGVGASRGPTVGIAACDRDGQQDPAIPQ